MIVVPATLYNESYQVIPSKLYAAFPKVDDIATNLPLPYATLDQVVDLGSVDVDQIPPIVSVMYDTTAELLEIATNVPAPYATSDVVLAGPGRDDAEFQVDPFVSEIAQACWLSVGTAIKTPFPYITLFQVPANSSGKKLDFQVTNSLFEYNTLDELTFAREVEIITQ